MKPLLSILLLISAFSPNYAQSFPYQLSTGKEVALMVPGSGLVIASAILHNGKQSLEAADILNLDPNQVFGIDRFATRLWNPTLNRWRESIEPASVVLAGVGIGTYGLWYKINSFEWEALKTLMLMYLEGAYIANGAMLATKVISKRPRPYTYNNTLSLQERMRDGNNESFFSGNATILFYNASFISKTFSDLFPDSSLKKWIWAGTLSVATLSAYWSVRSGMHFPTDVITGALVGGLAGYLIPLIHKKKVQGLTMQPWTVGKGGGISVGLTF